MSDDSIMEIAWSCVAPQPPLGALTLPSGYRPSRWVSGATEWQEHNHVFVCDRLNNTYFVMRHGFSVSNGKGITASNPDIACSGFGLTRLGGRQVRDQIGAAVRAGLLSADTKIVCSDFKRAWQSADVASRVLASKHPMSVGWLRERFFGELDLLDHESFFPCLHPFDVMDPFSSVFGCESAVQVMDRLSRGILSLESEFSGETILLVTHHDAMQILECVFGKKTPACYAGTPEDPRPLILNAEIRPLLLEAGA